MDFERLMLSKSQTPGSSTYVSNLAVVKDADHDYGFAELAEILGLNYDATKQVMYAGENSSYGIYLNIDNNNLQIRLYIKDTIITNSSFNNGNFALNQSQSRILYKKGDKGVSFGFSIDANNIINYIITTCITKENSIKNCYFFNSNSNNDSVFAFYSEENSSSEREAIRAININNNPAVIDNRSTSLISLCPLLNSFEDFYTNNIYLGIVYPAGKPTISYILNINNKEYVVLSRYNSNHCPILFETGNIITSS